MNKYPLEFIRLETARPTGRFSYVSVIFFNNLKNKKILKRGVIRMPKRYGHYDFCKDLQELFLQTAHIRPFVSREYSQLSKTYTYHIYLTI